MFDYLVVGSGLFGAVFAQQARERGESVLVVEKRSHIGGNIYTKCIDDIQVHSYGAHVFHTSSLVVWEYINQFAKFNNFVNAPIANYNGKIYNLPFNMNTFSKMWDISTPEQAAKIIAEQRSHITSTPRNLEEQAISLVGTDIYHKLIKEYTEKQWGRDCRNLPAFIINRLPIRFTYDNNYFNDTFQGIPVGGYTQIVEKMLEGCTIIRNTDYLENRGSFNGLAHRTLYTGPIDEYFAYCLGALEYRSVRFETQILEMGNFQGNAVVNYTDKGTPYTRIIEHKHFEFGCQPKTVITKEYSAEWKLGDEPYYPINDGKNSTLYEEYRRLAEKEKNVLFGGRLAEYQYYDMDKVILSALELSKKENCKKS